MLGGLPRRGDLFRAELHVECGFECGQLPGDAVGRRARTKNRYPKRPKSYTVRHAAVMKLDREGVSRSVARSITGHKTESMYLRYRIVRKEEQEAALAKMAR